MAVKTTNRMKNRAKRRAKRELRPQRQQTQRTVRQIKNQTRREVSSIRGAANMAADAVGTTSLRGLRGGYKNQVAREMAMRAADVQAAVPLMTAAVRSEGRQDIRAEQQSLPSLASVTQENLRAIKSARATKQKELETDRSERRDERVELRKDLQSELKDARVVAQRIMAESGRPPITSAEWAGLAAKVDATEGIGSTAAKRVVDALRRKQNPATPGIGTAAGLVDGG